MSYLILARKYRPQKFSDLIGQETTAKIVQAALSQDRVASAYLFSGPRGTGKTTTARIFAKALNCKGNPSPQPSPARGEGVPSSEPCNSCMSCDEIGRSTSMDVLELDAASHTGVDNIREVIINTVAYAPARDKYKVFIIDEVHMLSAQSFNALLKTLEEPPPHVVFILATTEYHKIPATIASRCQRFRFLPLTPKQIALNLKGIAGIEKISATDEALGLLARAAAGSMRDALSLFDQVISHMSGKQEQITLEKVEEILGIVREDFLVEFLRHLAGKDPKGALESIGRLLSEGHDLSYFLKEVREAFRQMLIEKCGYKEQDQFSGRRQALPANEFSLEELLRAGQLLSKCADAVRWNDFPRTVFECYTVKLCQKALDVPEILKRLENLEGGKSAPNPEPVRERKGPSPTPISSLAPAPAVPPAPVASEPPASNDAAWRKLLERVREEKPSLYPALQSAAPSWKGDSLELGFVKQFTLDIVKRNLGVLETILSALLKKKPAILFKIVQEAARPAAAAPSLEGNGGSGDEDTVVVEELHTTFEAMEQGETFEPIEGAPSPIEDAIEDEGTKKFLSVFHGKVKRNPGN